MWSFLQAIPVIGKIFDFGSHIADKIVELKIQQSNAQTEQERITIGEQVRVLELQQAQQAVEAQYNARTNQLIRFLFVVPVGVILWTYMIWDKVVCKAFSTETQNSSVCTTDPLDGNMWWIIGVVICFYFLQNISQILKR